MMIIAFIRTLAATARGHARPSATRRLLVATRPPATRRLPAGTRSGVVRGTAAGTRRDLV